MSYVVPLEILREACVNVYNRTRNIIGTQEGNRRLGIGAGGDWSRKIDVEAEEAVIRYQSRNMDYVLRLSVRNVVKSLDKMAFW